MVDYPVFAAGQRLLASQLTALAELTQTVIKTADESLASSNIFQDDDELFLPVEANALYLFELVLYGSSAGNSTGDLRTVFTFPAGSECAAAGQGAGNTALTTGSQASGEWIGRPAMVSGSSTHRLPYGLSVSTLSMVIVGRLDTGATAGTFRLQWAQETSHVDATTIKAGSYLKLQRIA